METKTENVVWTPWPKQAFALSIKPEQVYEILYGGSRGPGKTDCGIVWVAEPTDHPSFQALVIRRNVNDLYDWVNRAESMYGPRVKLVRSSPIHFTFPAGARIYVGHLKDEDAYTKYQGHEYARCLIEEAELIPSELLYEQLISSCRSTVPGLKPQVFLTANPLGPGHSWLKARFRIGKDYPTYKEYEGFIDEASGRGRIYISGTIDDNPTLMENDPEYVKSIEAMPEPWRSAWRYGDWDIFVGQYFKEWNPQVHIVSEFVARHRGYGQGINNRFGAIDWGYANPFAWLSYEVTPDKTIFFDHEYYGIERHPAQWGEDIRAHCESHKWQIWATFGDPSMWARNPMSWTKPETVSYTDQSIADALMSSGVPNLVPANNDRILGWRNVAQFMHYVAKESQPSVYIIEGTCPNLVRTIPLMLRDEKNPEDIAKKDQEDHACDAMRYGMMHLRAPVAPKKVRPADIAEARFQKLMMSEELEENEVWTYEYG